MIDLIVTGVAGTAVEQQSPPETSASGVAWPAIFGGAFAAIALTLLLFTLGSGLGLASVSPWPHVGASVGTFTVVTAIWLIVLHWLASGLGGYITGRLRTKWVGLHTHEVFFRDTANGFLTWAVATVFGAAIVAIGAAIVITGTAVTSLSATGHTRSAFPSSYLLDTLFRTDRPAVVGEDADFKAQSGRIILNGVSAGEVPAADKTYLAQLVSARTGLSSVDAARRVDAVLVDAKAAEAKVKLAADAARKAGASLSIFTALAMLIGAFIACVAAALGGQQRDEY
jgi:hypothetical protein